MLSVCAVAEAYGASLPARGLANLSAGAVALALPDALGGAGQESWGEGTIVAPWLAGVGVGAMVVGTLWALGKYRRSRRRGDAGLPGGALSDEGLERIPAQIVVQDLSAVYASLEQIRAQGVKEIWYYLEEHPEFVRECLTKVRLVAANRAAIHAAGFTTLDEWRRAMPEFKREYFRKIVWNQLCSLWAGLQLSEFDIAYRDEQQHPRSCFMRFQFSDPLGQRDLRCAVLMAVDTTNSVHAAEGRFESNAMLREILAQANILLWWSRVRLEDGRLKWQINIAKNSFETPIYHMASAVDRGGLWDLEQMPDKAQMARVSEGAVLSNLPGYHQEFRLIRDGRVYWMNEDVVINRLSADEWSLVGVVSDITERRAAEEAQRRSSGQVRHILERADFMVWECEVRANNGEWDWAFEVPPSGMLKRLFGTTEGIRTKDIFAGMSVPQLPAKNQIGCSAILRGDPHYEQEFQIIRPDGESLWLHERVSVTPTGPKQWHLAGVTTDVTARRMAEEARRLAEEQKQQILMKADCLLWQAKVTGGPSVELDWKLYVPPSVLYRRLFGGDPSPDNAKLWNESTLLPQAAEMHDRCRRAVLSGAGFYEQEFQVIIGKRKFWLHEHVSITTVSPGEWNLVGVIVDITARREAEFALAAEKERLAVTLRAMSEAVITLDAHEAVQFMNRAAANLTQWDGAAAEGRAVKEVCAFFNVVSGEPVEIPMGRVLQDGAMADLPPDTILKKKDGRSCQVEGCLAPVQDSSGRTIGAVLVFRDVTERQRLEDQIQRTTKMESVGLLAGGIAHDFNNILTAIIGNITLARMDVGALPDAEHCLDEAQNAATRARDLTQQLLTFAKGGDPVKSSLLLNEIVREAVVFSLHGSRLKCDFDLAENLWPVDADKGQIVQVIQNLVINAVQAMPDGGSLRISGRNETVGDNGPVGLAPGDFVRIAVVDTGTGIRPEHLGKVFDPYFTTKSHGHGLGLATVYSIIRKHQGRIEVTSELGRGTTFTFWLPASKSLPIDAPAKLAGTTEPLKGRVLFMDDEEAILSLAQRMIGRLGLEVVLARDGEEAVRKYAEALQAGRRFDLVIMDLTVPGGMGGKEALIKLRDLDPTVVAVVSSGYSSDPILSDYRLHGFVEMVAKPYQVNELTRVVRSALRARQS